MHHNKHHDNEKSSRRNAEGLRFHGSCESAQQPNSETTTGGGGAYVALGLGAQDLSSAAPKTPPYRPELFPQAADEPSRDATQGRWQIKRDEQSQRDPTETGNERSQQKNQSDNEPRGQPRSSPSAF
jgi:hypothetical protein